jgi:hypothetical protein
MNIRQRATSVSVLFRPCRVVTAVGAVSNYRSLLPTRHGICQIKSMKLLCAAGRKVQMKTLKKDARRWIAAGTLTAMALGSVATITAPAQAAGSSTWKKAAIAAGVVTGYGLLKHKGTVTTVGAVATAGSYYMYRRKKKQEEQRRQRWYQNHYGRNWRSHYNAGH